MIGWVQEALAGKTPNTAGSWEQIDQWNEESYRENQNKPLAQILANFHSVYQETATLVQSIDEDVLTDSNRFPWLNGKALWTLIGGDAYSHYQEHHEAIETWLKTGPFQNPK